MGWETLANIRPATTTFSFSRSVVLLFFNSVPSLVSECFRSSRFHSLRSRFVLSFLFFSLSFFFSSSRWNSFCSFTYLPPFVLFGLSASFVSSRCTRGLFHFFFFPPVPHLFFASFVRRCSFGKVSPRFAIRSLCQTAVEFIYLKKEGERSF